jgi:hypothetical protein
LYPDATDRVGYKYELVVLESEEASMDNPMYEVKDLERFKHGFNVVDAEGKVFLQANGTAQQFFLYASEPTYAAQNVDPTLNLYKLACVTYDPEHRQMSVRRMRSRNDNEALLAANLAGVPGDIILIAEVVRSKTITHQAHVPEKPELLVGYWHWSKPISIPLVKDKIELKVAKNSDLILYCSGGYFSWHSCIRVQRKQLVKCHICIQAEKRGSFY